MKRFVRDHFEEFVNKQNAAVIRKNMTSDFLDHDGPGGKPTDVVGDERMMAGMYKAMADLHLTIEEQIGLGLLFLRVSIPGSKKLQAFGKSVSRIGFPAAIRLACFVLMSIGF
jgi:hypothetical protein